MVIFNICFKLLFLSEFLQMAFKVVSNPVTCYDDFLFNRPACIAKQRSMCSVDYIRLISNMRKFLNIFSLSISYIFIIIILTVVTNWLSFSWIYVIETIRLLDWSYLGCL